jgi:hypothetical protein
LQDDPDCKVPYADVCKIKYCSSAFSPALWHLLE